jgi:preprotein translocase subunit SecG
MTVFPFLAVSFIMKVLAVLFLLCSVALILVVLIQKGRGGGLSGAFGGAMASGILGSKTGDFLTWVTIVLVGIFLTLAVVMAKFYKPSVGEFGTVQQQQPTTPGSSAPAQSPQPTTRGTSDSNASGGVGTAQPEQPSTTEQALPTQGTDSGAGEANGGNDVNMPGQ